MLSEQWDVLCAVEDKDHHNAGLISYSKGYKVCYAGDVHGDYFGIVMFIRHGALPLGGCITKGSYFFFSVELEHNRH